MAHNPKHVNPPHANNPQNDGMANNAPLANVAICLGTVAELVDRPRHLPGIGVFYGPSGYGKSTAASIARIHYNAYYVQARDTWTRKSTHEAICKEMGIVPSTNLSTMVDQVAEQLILSGRPLIIDEADFLVRKGQIEIIRDLYEASLAPILIIGEERLPTNLMKWERFHGRVLSWAAAQPPSYQDALALRDLYANRVSIADDLMQLVHKKAEGSVRRIAVNIELIQKTALNEGRDSMDMAAWGSKPLHTGNPPARR